ncbi:hypothetical protein ACQP1P_35400 [Dactylosporangium sp. CA-052675]|uniref:hypothetical protein n=1 Tax=Dactylosporangium sp. CA-052675 TaxID=3239927 RepID=UPI003D8B2C34
MLVQVAVGGELDEPERGQMQGAVAAASDAAPAVHDRSGCNADAGDLAVQCGRGVSVEVGEPRLVVGVGADGGVTMARSAGGQSGSSESVIHGGWKDQR